MSQIFTFLKLYLNNTIYKTKSAFQYANYNIEFRLKPFPEEHSFSPNECLKILEKYSTTLQTFFLFHLRSCTIIFQGACTVSSGNNKLTTSFSKRFTCVFACFNTKSVVITCDSFKYYQREYIKLRR